MTTTNTTSAPSPERRRALHEGGVLALVAAGFAVVMGFAGIASDRDARDERAQAWVRCQQRTAGALAPTTLGRDAAAACDRHLGYRPGGAAADCVARCDRDDVAGGASERCAVACLRDARGGGPPSAW